MYAESAVARTHDTKQVDTFMHLIGVLVGFAGVACVALAAVYVLRLGVLPFRYALLIFGVDAVIALFPLYLLIKKKFDIKKVLCIVLSALMAIFNLFVVSYGDLTYNFLNDQYGVGSVGNVEYCVVAQSTSRIELQSAKRTLSAGIQSTDICKDEAEAEMQKLAPAEFSEYDNVSELISATEGGGVEIAVVQTAFLDAFAEYFPDSYEKLSILTKFKTDAGTTSSPLDGIAIDITKPFAIYVSGADDYGDIDQTARSDVNMLVLIDPENYRILLANTPRDYYVQLHGTNGLPDKLTHAGTYGIDVSEATLEDLYDINIDYHVHINYDTLINLIDRLGGISIYNPNEFNLWGAQFDKGNIYMDGAHALLYARARKELPNGDNDRGENQQRVISGIVARISAANVATQYTQILERLSGTFRSNIPPSVIAQLFKRQISLGGNWDIETTSATGTNDQRPTYSMGADRPLSVIIPDQDSVDAVSEQMQSFLSGVDPEVGSGLGAPADSAVE
ncbi:MAG: LCP family protein [Clostridiales Family XIII bacterium]|jgi:LCP family protein required for cell wall assembly|nr:LCP family protein [Clostridiales Family XIII bacterium]